MAAPPARTVRDIIKSAYRKLGAGSDGDTLSAEDINNGLIAFQDLLAEVSGGVDMVLPAAQIETINLVVGQTQYTIGENGSPDKSAVRPQEITLAYVKRTGSGSDYDYPVQIIGEAAYALIVDKETAGGSWPEYLWYNPTTPNGTINVYRPPSDTDTLYIQYPYKFVDGGELTDDIMVTLGLPRNYANPLIFMLAIDLSPELGVDPSPVVVARAQEGERAIKALVAQNTAQGLSIEFAYNRGTRSDLDPYG